MAESVLRLLLQGFIRLHVPCHADKEPICGVELMEELQHYGYDIGPGRLYPALHQMKEADLLTCTEDVVDGKRRKTSARRDRAENC